MHGALSGGLRNHPSALSSNAPTRIRMASGDIEIKQEYIQEYKLEANEAIRGVFLSLDDDHSGKLGLAEFERALTQMDIVVPVPIINFIFEKIDDDNSGEIGFDEFIAFCNDRKVVKFNVEYDAKFEGAPYGLNLIVDSGEDQDTKVFVADVDKSTRRYVLPGSEIVAIDGRKIANMTGEEIWEIFDEIKDRPPKSTVLTFLKQSSEDGAKLGLMMGDEDFLVMSKHISRMKLEHRIKALKKPPEPFRHTKHCPDEELYPISCHIHRTFEDEDYNYLSYSISIIVMILILVSTVAFVIETLPSLEGSAAFIYIEWVVSLCFTVEYVSRILSSRNAWLFFWDTMNLIDFLAVIPFWIEQSFGTSGGSGGSSLLRVVRVIRLARVFRLLKTKRLTDYMDIFARTLKKSTQSASLLVTILSLQIIVFASLEYFCEQGTQDSLTGDYERTDGDPSPFISIPASAWWCIVTMTTVGYGDLYPVETAGMFIAVVAMFIGLFVIALPVIIIGDNFTGIYVAYLQKQQREARLEYLLENGLWETSVEKFFEDVNRWISVGSGDPKMMVDFFTEEEIWCFVQEDYLEGEHLEAVLSNGRTSIHFLPRGVPQYKLFVLYEVFGKLYREELDEQDPFSLVKQNLMSKIQLN